MTRNKAPGSVAAWVATLVNADGKSVAYGRFRAKRMQDRVRRDLARLGEPALAELAGVLDGAWTEDGCSVVEAQAAAAEILAIAGAAEVLRAALQASLARTSSTQEVLLRRSLVSAIGDLGPEGAGATAAVQALLRAEDFGLRQTALFTLARICADAGEVDAAITAGLADPVHRVVSVAQAVQRMRAQP